MSRYIDADGIRKPIYAEEDNCTGIGMTFDEMDAYNDGIDAMIRQIDNVPTADVKEVVRGKWIKYGVDVAEHPYHCSHCGWGNFHIQRYIYDFNFCPHCGADLRRE